MESALASELINELAQGMEYAKQLRFHLYTTSPSKAGDLLLQDILSSYEKSVQILKNSGSTSKASRSLARVNESPKSEGVDNIFRNHSEQSSHPQKRRLQPTWTAQVIGSSENGFEGPTVDDGYSWRKYGQKDILGAKYPRSYYRCTYRSLQNCWATKQVQRSDNDPTIFEIMCKGTHTCNHSLATIPTQPPPEYQDSEHNRHEKALQQQNQAMLNLEATNFTDDNEDLHNMDMMQADFSVPACQDTENRCFPFSDSLIYSSTFSSPYYQIDSYQEALNLGSSKSDITKNVSAHASNDDQFFNW